MNKFAAFLRSINVGGHHIVKMEDLRRMFASMNFENVKTYIQSGNVIFETKEKNAGSIAAKIERKLFEALGFEVKTMLRTIPELEDVAKHNPFTESDDVKVYITFLSAAPDEEKKRAVEALGNELESFQIRNRELYSSLDKNVKKSLFTSNFTEKHLKISGTTRNPRTLAKMILLGSDES
jgi:uncharacterized protein (DUF1697 family)